MLLALLLLSRLESYSIHLGGQVIDLASTEIGLSNPKNREGNPLMSNRAVRIPYKLAAGIFVSEVDHKIKSKKRRWIFRIALGSLYLGVAVNNISKAN